MGDQTAGRRYLLADCTNFYVSCERAMRPAWRHRPCAVLSNNDGSVIARCQALKAAGIPMGVPYFQVRETLRAMQAVVVSSNYALYGDLSRRVVEVLRRFAPRLEIYSIDECFLDITDVPAARVSDLGREVARTTYRWTGIPLGIGIGPTKTLAKLANRIAKRRQVPGGVFDLGGAAHLDDVLAAFAVDELWGVGQRWAGRLAGLEIRTARDLRDADPALIRRQFGVVLQRVVFELRGVSCLALEQVQPKRQIRVARSFGQKVADRAALAEATAGYAARAGEKLRAQGSTAGAVQVFVETHVRGERRGESRAATVTFEVPSGDSRRLLHAAVQAIGRLYRPGEVYRKSGVLLLDLAPTAQGQLDLFSGGDAARAQALMQTVDAVNARFGRGKLFFARQGIARPWAMRCARRTPAYTSRWSALPRAH